MKACVINCFDTVEERAGFIKEALIKKNYEVEVLTTNFSHLKKERRKEVPSNYLVINTQQYKRNISISRIMSHNQFAVDAFYAIDGIKPDLVWVLAPSNFLIQRANKYKKKHPNVKIIIDMIDMWPESLPVKYNKEILPFRIWRNLRKNNLKCADEVVTECDYYHEILSKEYSGKITTLHWAKRFDYVNSMLDLPKDKLGLCYLGSINNIINIDLMKKMIETCNKKVILHVIGGGENKDYLIKTLSEVCEVIYHGEIYNNREKGEIIAKCHAGFNLYKDDLYIGLTMKCIDYYMFGLPIINNIKGDTWKMVDEFNVGMNINNDSILDANKIIELRNNNEHILNLFNKCFTKEVFIDKCIDVIDRVN